MIKEKIILKETTIRHKYCDDCESKINTGLYCSRAVCEKCGKDLCEKCIKHEEETHGDYRIVYCKSCWEIGETYRSTIKKLEDKIDDLYEEWELLCKK